MRTTLTLEDDVAKAVKAEMRGGRSLKDVVNAALRRGLRMGGKPEPTPPRFVVETFTSAFLPGIDPGRLNRLVDELDVEDSLGKIGRSGRR